MFTGEERSDASIKAVQNITFVVQQSPVEEKHYSLLPPPSVTDTQPSTTETPVRQCLRPPSNGVKKERSVSSKTGRSVGLLFDVTSETFKQRRMGPCSVSQRALSEGVVLLGTLRVANTGTASPCENVDCRMIDGSYLWLPNPHPFSCLPQHFYPSLPASLAPVFRGFRLGGTPPGSPPFTSSSSISRPPGTAWHLHHSYIMAPLFGVSSWLLRPSSPPWLLPHLWWSPTSTSSF
ncbi:unnamed protein product [Leuciscus chuanchicus]